METYKEYPIRCKTCNEPIACFSYDYEALLNAGFSIEEALDELGITDYCSRQAMLNPTIVPFNMENREVIEGFKSVDAANDADAQNESTSDPIFSQCMTLQPGLPVGQTVQQTLLSHGINVLTPALPTLTGGIPTLTGGMPTQRGVLGQTRTLPNAPMQTTGLTQPGPRAAYLNMPTLGAIIPTARPIAQVIQPMAIPIHTETTPQIIAPIIPGIDLDIDLEALGEGIEVKPLENIGNKFEMPISVGIPTINPDPSAQPVTIYVGAKKYVTVLNGRTYLAQ